MKKKLIFIILLLFTNLIFAENFSNFIGSLKTEAKAQGFSQEVITEAFKNVQQLSRATYYNTHQRQVVDPFLTYLKISIPPTRVALGKENLHLYRTILEKVSSQYHVPEQYIVALWGLETNYGQITGSYPEFSALTTLAYHSNRHDLFKREIWAALTMLQENKVTMEKMKGSWAGAMGQCQFMPTAYLLFGIRYNHEEGAPDIWATMPDIFASMANYLQQEGWNNQYSMLFEVKLTKKIASHLIGLNTKKPMDDWLEQGIVSVDGKNISKQKGFFSLLLPDGTKGPAYLVNWNNFRVIMRWNSSTYYAISVGLLANQLVE